MNRPSETSRTAGTLVVCSTSHMDWDWQVTHKTYYEDGTASTRAVRTILDEAVSILTDPADPGYQYNLCELAWLQDYLKEFPEKLGDFQRFSRRQFQLMGGGITSPDNLVCNGELFIRNYLLGRIYARRNGLSHLVSNVCWIPDDFGHDPQLPVVVEAMAMKGAAFWRVPGNQPEAPGPISPLDGAPSIATQLKADGVTFLWQANDGSTTVAQNLWSGYGVIWQQNSANGAAELDEFVRAYTSGCVEWPNALLFAPCGGDFSPASTQLLHSVDTYNADYADETGITAVLGSFEDYLDRLHASGVDLGPPMELDPSNFWTGYFSSQVALKRLQQGTVSHLLAAESLATLLLAAGIDPSSLESLNESIAEVWELAAPSSHHDYVTGTSVDSVYRDEQRPLLAASRAGAGKALETAMHLLGGSVETRALQGELPCVVFNPLGAERRLGRITALSVPDAGRFRSVRIDGHLFPVQHTTGQELRFEAPAQLPSLGYRVVSLSTAPSPDGDAVRGQSDGRYWILENSKVRLVVDSQSGCAISSMIDKENGDAELVQAGEYANRLAIYNENYPPGGSCQAPETYAGNLYQMGNENYPQCTDGAGFYLSETLVAGATPPSFVDQGPLVWTLRCPLEDSSGNPYTLDYTLYKDESLVRIRLEGAAAQSLPHSVVTSWAMQNGPAEPPARHAYGTANHWADDTVEPYWHGPTFRCTHDFAMLLGADQQPIGAIYHDGIPSWAFDDGALEGILLRNPSGGGRGASATDTDSHVQRFAYRLPGVGRPETCDPLQESTAFQLPPRAVLAPGGQATLPERGQLAGAEQGELLIRVGRTQENDSDRTRSFILRLYQPTRARGDYELGLPFLAQQDATAEWVTALEEPTSGPSPTLAGTTLHLEDMPTLATVRIVLE